MLTTLLEMVSRIKSPQLYQLSYRPKSSKLLGKARAQLGSFGAVVPVVYPTGTSMSSTPPRVSWEWPSPDAEMDPDQAPAGAE